MKEDSFVQNPDIAHVKPRFEDWKLIKAQALITGKVSVTEDKLRVEFRLWDGSRKSLSIFKVSFKDSY